MTPLVPTFPAECDETGTLKISKAQKQAIKRWCKTLKGQQVEVVIRKRRSKRSLDQNAFWWAVPVRLMAEEWGVSADQAHYLLLAEWKGWTDGPLGRIPNLTSSSKLTVDEFTELIKWVLDYGPAEWNVYIPSPNEVEWKGMVA